MFKQIVTAAILLTIVSCAATPESAVNDPEGLVFRSEASAQEQDATEFSHEGTTLRLGPPMTFELSRAYATVDALGYPAVGFEVAEPDSARFSEWTDSIVGQRLAVLIDGRVITAPVVNSALQGQGVITGGARGFTDDEVRELLESLRPALR